MYLKDKTNVVAIVFLVFKCSGTLSLSTPVDADDQIPPSADFLLCCSRVVAFLMLFFFFPLQSFILKYLLNLLAGQYCFVLALRR